MQLITPLRRVGSCLALAATLSALPAAAATVPPVLTAAPCTLPAFFDLSARDEARFNDLAASRLRGLVGALASSDASAREQVAALFADGLVPTASIPIGAYRCRSIELGGLLPITIYAWFSCRIMPTDDGWAITKPTGSQRLAGLLVPAGGGLAYRGALYYSDEDPIPYAGDTDRDQIGCLVRTGGDAERYLLELPDPVFNEEHNVIELVPAVMGHPLSRSAADGRAACGS